jgi:hypothetical protein
MLAYPWLVSEITRKEFVDDEHRPYWFVSLALTSTSLLEASWKTLFTYNSGVSNGTHQNWMKLWFYQWRTWIDHSKLIIDDDNNNTHAAVDMEYSMLSPMDRYSSENNKLIPLDRRIPFDPTFELIVDYSSLLFRH